MAAYNGRRAPNVSQYLANLNTMHSPPDMVQPGLGLGDDSLDFLTNTEFFDFDQFNPNAAADAAAAFEAQNELSDASAFPYDFAAYQAAQQQQHNLASPATLPPTPPNGISATAAGSYSQFSQHSPVLGDKRKASVALPGQTDLEEVSRMAAEEDKRRRNTAASARFRVKKKQREQALEKQAKEMSDKVSALESKVQQLEMENKWLKELITDKTEAGKLGEGEKERKASMVVTAEQQKEEEERSTGNRTDGVGTKIEVGSSA